MSKTITSPVKRFLGTVTLSDPLTYPQVIAVEDALDEAREVAKSAETGELHMSRIRKAVLPGICSCVEEWNLAGFGQLTPETFPASPRKSADELVAWLQGEVIALFSEQDDIPNG